MHIFWQRRVREGDEYPYWFPSQTTGGRMGEARIVLPILPGTHWSDAKPMVLPGGAGMENAQTVALPDAAPKKKRSRAPKPLRATVPEKSFGSGGLRFAPAAAIVQPKSEKPKRQKQKNDPKHVAAAREVRDRYLEEVNTGRMLPGGGANGKYDVSRQLAASPSPVNQTPLLDAA